MGKKGSTAARPSPDPHPERPSSEQQLRDIVLAAGRLLREHSLDRAVTRALGMVGTALEADTVQIFEYHSGDATDASTVIPRFGWGCAGHEDERLGDRRLDNGESPIQTDPRPRSTADVEATFSDPDVAPPDTSQDSGRAFTLTLPITVDGKTWGTLRLDTSDPKVRWTRDEVALLETMAKNFGWVIAEHQQDENAEQSSFDVAAHVQDAVAQVVRRASASGQLTGAVAVVAADAEVLYQNDRLGKLCGRTREQLNEAGGLPACLANGETQAQIRETLADGASFEGTVDLATDGATPRLQITPVHGLDGEALLSLCILQDLESSSREASSERYALNLRRRVRAERALVEASKLLVASEACDYEQLLRIVGEATGARYAYLVIVAPGDVVNSPQQSAFALSEGKQPIHLDTYTQYEWFSPTASEAPTASEPPVASNPPVDAGRDEVEPGPTFAVPILSSEDQLFGYLGIEYEVGAAPCRDEDARILSVLGDMLCTYLQRQISEEALRRSEQRYRHFVDTISEAIWRVELDPPIATDGSPEEQVEALMRHGVVAECNAAMAQLFGLHAPEDLIGCNVSKVTALTGRGVLEDLVRVGYRLRNHEYVVSVGRRAARYFVINTVGVQEDGRLTGVWGSCTEVTDRVELERRMVAALEQQQQRIGRDLHDSVGQQLAGTRMLAQNLADRYFPEEDQGGHREIQKIISYVQEAVQHVNDLQRGVMPVQVERDGLAQALKELASRTDMLADVDCLFLHDNSTDVYDHEVKLQLYRIAQEATRNAITHANPSCIELKLNTEDEAVVLGIRDDGTGFEVERSENKGQSLGLHSMRYRARAIGAVLDIGTRPGEGTRIRCTVPLARLSAQP